MKELLNLRDAEGLKDIQIDPVKMKAARGKLTPKQVADEVGVSPQHIWNIEHGHRKPSADLLIQLCTLYGVDCRELSITEDVAA